MYITGLDTLTISGKKNRFIFFLFFVKDDVSGAVFRGLYSCTGEG